jgi:hypothetical protein
MAPLSVVLDFGRSPEAEPAPVVYTLAQIERMIVDEPAPAGEGLPAPVGQRRRRPELRPWRDLGRPARDMRLKD